MCKESHQQQQTTQTRNIPDWLESASRSLTDRALSVGNQEFTPYAGQRVAGFSGDQDNAFQALRNFFSTGGGQQGFQTYANTGAQNVSTERSVDENGRLGSVSDYMSPYVEGALQPALRKIQESADAARKRLGAGATASGAFGDARHGVQEASLDLNTSQAMGDTAATFMNNAFGQAMGQRQNDLNRFGATDLANAQFSEQALQRLLTGTQAGNQNTLQNIQSLLASGSLQQQNNQSGLDAIYQDFLRQYGHDSNMLNAASGAIGRLPYSQTTTGDTQTTQPNNSLLGMLGAGAGAFAGSNAGSAMIASMLGAI